MRSLIPHLLLSTIQGNYDSLTSLLKPFESVLFVLGLLGDTSKTYDLWESVTFDRQNWSLVYVTFQITATLLQLKPILTGDEEVQPEEAVTNKLKHLFSLLNSLLLGIAQGVGSKCSFDGKELIDGTAIPELTFFITQTLSWLILIYQTWLKLLPSGKKKKSPEPLTSDIRTATKDLNSELKNILTELARVLKPSPEAKGLPDISQSCIQLPKEEKSAQLPEKIFANIVTSQRASLAHLLVVVNAKLNVLRTLRS